MQESAEPSAHIMISGEEEQLEEEEPCDEDVNVTDEYIEMEPDNLP